jgi:hypothetical protein
MTISVGPSVSVGTYEIIVTGKENNVTHRSVVPVSVVSRTTNEFSLGTTPTSVSLKQSATIASTISTAVTSGTAQTVNLVATVLPKGPSVSLSNSSLQAGNSSILTVSASSSTPPGTYLVTITGKEGNATHQTFVQVFITPSTVGLLQDSSFEENLGVWQVSSAQGYPIIDTIRPHTGLASAWLCGYDNCRDVVWQTVTLPGTTTKVVLKYWLYISTNQSSNACVDFFRSGFKDQKGTIISTLQTQCNKDAKGWTQYTFDVTSLLHQYKGQQITLYFQGTTDSADMSNYLVDDASLVVTY